MLGVISLILMDMLILVYLRIKISDGYDFFSLCIVVIFFVFLKKIEGFFKGEGWLYIGYDFFSLILKYLVDCI